MTKKQIRYVTFVSVLIIGITYIIRFSEESNWLYWSGWIMCIGGAIRIIIDILKFRKGAVRSSNNGRRNNPYA